MNNAGLPGTGLGGIFYLLLALWMPFSELYRTARGRSSRARWRFVARQAALACTMVAALVATTALFVRLVDVASPFGLHGSVLAVAPALLAVLLLAVLALGLRIWARLVPSGPASTAAAEVQVSGSR